MNNPLVVLSTQPMHILKKYPVNVLCIGLVRRLDKKNQHPHTAPSQSAAFPEEQMTYLAIT